LYDPILFVVAVADPMRATMQQEQRRCRSCSSGGATGAKDQGGGAEAEGHGTRECYCGVGAEAESQRGLCGGAVLPSALILAECAATPCFLRR